MNKYCFLILLILGLQACNGQTKVTVAQSEKRSDNDTVLNIPFDTTFKTIHVFVALCDNQYQGIVPVSAKIGNGQDPNNNLYWGCGYGIRTYFKHSKDWVLVGTRKPDTVRMERLIFKHRIKKYYLIADAYDGKYIERCTYDFLKSSCGQNRDTVRVLKNTIGIGGNASLVSYIGHDGLMDFDISDTFVNTDKKKRDIIILACYSKKYFSGHLNRANINPLVWTNGLMAPEAYTLHDALTGYINKESNEAVRSRAALAYARYQKCGVTAARNILVTGW